MSSLKVISWIRLIAWTFVTTNQLRSTCATASQRTPNPHPNSRSATWIPASKGWFCLIDPPWLNTMSEEWISVNQSMSVHETSCASAYDCVDYGLKANGVCFSAVMASRKWCPMTSTSLYHGMKLFTVNAVLLKFLFIKESWRKIYKITNYKCQ